MDNEDYFTKKLLKKDQPYITVRGGVCVCGGEW